MKEYVSIDIGGTAIKYSVINEDVNILIKKEIDTEAYLGGNNIIKKVKNIIANFNNEYNICGICISTAGMVGKNGEILYANELIPNYTGIHIKKLLEEEFDLPCEVDNDVNCAGLAEAINGAGKDAEVSVCLTVGTGIGGCIVIDKKIFHGFSNSACSVGYMNINGGIFEKVAAASVLTKNVALRKNIDVNTINGKYIFENAKLGDIICIEEIDNMIDYLTYGIANICYILNPQVVILGGGIMSQQEYLKERIDVSLKNKLIENIYKNTSVVFAENKNDAGIIGAYYNFIQKR